MNTGVEEHKIFTKVTIVNFPPKVSTFDTCTFLNCDFQYGKFADIAFSDCKFKDCNLALCDVSKTGLQNVAFEHCKLSGINFSKCNDFLFEVSFTDCILDNAVFFRKKLKGTQFTDSSLIEADFTEADLTKAAFTNCNLNNAFFDLTVLKEADLRTSYNFIINPDKNVIKKARFSTHGLHGLLAKYDIRVEG